MADDVEKATATIAASNTEQAPAIMRRPMIVIPYVRWYQSIKWTMFTCISLFVFYKTEYDQNAPAVYWVLLLHAVGSVLTTMLAILVDVTYPYVHSEKGN